MHVNSLGNTGANPALTTPIVANQTPPAPPADGDGDHDGSSPAAKPAGTGGLLDTSAR